MPCVRKDRAAARTGRCALRPSVPSAREREERGPDQPPRRSDEAARLPSLLVDEAEALPSVSLAETTISAHLLDVAEMDDAGGREEESDLNCDEAEGEREDAVRSARPY